MKVLALYLPQFHRVLENDVWWGDGFTEWTAVKEATPLYEGHKQPRVPYHGEYYNLLEKDTLLKQCNLMHEYGIDGMCFYHYWFKDGRKILEKPAENLLTWKDIDMPFCFSWANESWIRSWSKVQGGNPWAIKYDKKINRFDDEGLLLEQQYGAEEEWKQHFYYLLSFFKDERYIKHEGRPVFLIHRPHKIDCLRGMLNCWNRLAIQEGIAPLYVIGSYPDKSMEQLLDGQMLQEPQDTIQRFFANQLKHNVNEMKYIDYEEVWKKLIAKQINVSNLCLGGFVGYDDSPRRGKRGTILDKASPELFYSYMKKLFVNAERLNSPYVFINAWNEWGEGMYLEPDEEYGYQYLNALYRAKKDYKTADSKLSKDENLLETLLQENSNLIDTNQRYKNYWIIFNKWLTLIETKDSISQVLHRKNINCVAIYGMGMFGRHLVDDLKKGNIHIEYIIDQQHENIVSEFPMYSLQDEIPPVELVIIAVGYDVISIKEKLVKKGFNNIISLEELIDEG